MSHADDSDENRKTGYKRPPIAKRFKKGQSGNPKGRPKGTKSIADTIRQAVNRTVDIREGEKRRSMSKIAAAIEIYLAKALKGDHRAFVKIMDLAAKTEIFEAPSYDPPRITEVCRVYTGTREEIEELKAQGIPEVPEDEE